MEKETKETKEITATITIKPSQIEKAIKGLSVGKDKIEIMKRVANLMGYNPKLDNPQTLDEIVEAYLELEGYYNIAVSSRQFGVLKREKKL